MTRTRIAAATLAGCLLFCLLPGAAADTGFRNAWRADYPDVCAPLYNLNCAVCHTAAPALNAYGEDILAFGDGPGIEGLDSDGDGYTNGQEILVDCTNPADAGDHGVVAADGATWSGIKVLFR